MSRKDLILLFDFKGKLIFKDFLAIDRERQSSDSDNNGTPSLRPKSAQPITF